MKFSHQPYQHPVIQRRFFGYCRLWHCLKVLTCVSVLFASPAVTANTASVTCVNKNTPGSLGEPKIISFSVTGPDKQIVPSSVVVEGMAAAVRRNTPWELSWGGVRSDYVFLNGVLVDYRLPSRFKNEMDVMIGSSHTTWRTSPVYVCSIGPKTLRLEVNVEDDSARALAEQKAKLEAEKTARALAEQKAKLEAEKTARALAEQKAELEREQRARALAEQKAELEREQRARALTEQKSGSNDAGAIPQLALRIASSDPKEAIEEIDLKITLYAKIANNLPQTEASYRVQQKVLDKKIEELRKVRESLAASYLAKYNTPIYPVNINLGTTAFRYSEIFPSIPYYIPGTKEVGEFLVQPVVSNKGQLTYEFTFLDPSAKYKKERDQIVVVNTDMDGLIDGLDKVREWTETAEKQNVRRRFEKVASCFPKTDCGSRQVGKASTEVVFQIYENGSTSGKLQRVKGEFVSGYNMSVESTVLLGAYLKYMRDIGEQEFKVGSMTEKDLDSMFK